MKLIQNTTLQGFFVMLDTPTGPLNLFLKPKERVAVPDNYGGKILDTLIKRKRIKVVKS